MSNKKQNINESKSWKITRLVLLALISLVWMMSIQSKRNSSVSKVDISIDPLVDNKFLINDKEVGALIVKHLGYGLENVNISKIDLFSLENYLKNDKRIDKIEMFVDKHNRLKIEIDQKNPVLRIKDKDQAYYIDKEGKYIPVKKGAAVRVPVATGKIGAYDAEAIIKKGTVLNDLLQLANYIAADKDFRAPLVDQIDVNNKREITLVPKVGRNTIEFGTIENMEDKFYKLKVYYKEGVRKTGLDKFATLNVKYKDQVVLKEK